MTNPINGMTINEALKKSESAYDNDWVKAFYWLAVVAIKCLLKLAYHSKDC